MSESIHDHFTFTPEQPVSLLVAFNIRFVLLLPAAATLEPAGPVLSIRYKEEEARGGQ